MQILTPEIAKKKKYQIKLIFFFVKLSIVNHGCSQIFLVITEASE